MMRHLKRGRKFGRVRGQRRTLLRNLAGQLITRARITTTEARAKELAPLVEKLITVAKRNTAASRRALAAMLPRGAADKLSTTIRTRMEVRPGGCTRITKLGPRKSDRSRMAIVEFMQ